MIYSYTDEHNVDEDIATIPSCSGYCDRGANAGIFLRQPDNPTNVRHDAVAFGKKINRTYTPFGDAYLPVNVEAGHH